MRNFNSRLLESREKLEYLATLAQFPTWLRSAGAWKELLRKSTTAGCHGPITPDCLLATRAKGPETETSEMLAKPISLLTEQVWSIIYLLVALN